MNRPFSRREFIGAALVASALSGLSLSQTAEGAKTGPWIDGLCLDVPDSPDDIRASGLTALVYDVSRGETAPMCDGSPAWQRTWSATTKSIAEAKEKLKAVPNVFLATEGREINDALRDGKTAVFLQVQGGGQIIGSDLSRLTTLREMGLKVFQITHHHDNPLGGGGIVRTPHGLTKLGFQAVERMNKLGLIPDLSHSSDQTGLDTLKTSKKPVVISHGAVRAIVNNARCSPDEVIRGVARSGGVMGIFMMSFWYTNDALPTPEAYVKQLRHVINIGGIDAVGIANDFPLSGEAGLVEAKGDNAKAVKNYFNWWGSIAELGVLGFDKEPKHVAIPEWNNNNRFRLIQETLEKERFTSVEIEKIMGGNWMRVLSS